MTKVCIDCKLELDIDNFQIISSRNKEHRRQMCKKCAYKRYNPKSKQVRLRKRKIAQKEFLIKWKEIMWR